MNSDNDFFGFVIFCDDLRDEATGKVSYMGVYHDLVGVQVDLPVALPTFAAAVHVFFKEEIRTDDVEIYMRLPQDPIDGPATIMLKIDPDAVAGLQNFGLSHTHAVFKLGFHQFALVEQGMIRVQVRWGSEVHNVGEIRVLDARNGFSA